MQQKDNMPERGDTCDGDPSILQRGLKTGVAGQGTGVGVRSDGNY